MDLHGSLGDNLQAALKSITRHRNLTVHGDTRVYWDSLLEHAQSVIDTENVGPEIVELARKLGLELLERDRRASIARL